MYKISTQTFVVYSDVSIIDLKLIFNDIEICDKIVGVKYELEYKGHVTKSAASSRNFLKCITFNVIIVTKKLGVKLFRNGTIQITGCKSNQHANQCINLIYPLILKRINKQIITYHIASVMLNINFDVGFNINREHLGKYMFENQTDINIPPLTSGYMGLKLKFPYVNAKTKINIPKIEWNNNVHTVVDNISYEHYFKNVNKKLSKRFLTSISIFQNGKVLISGVDISAVELAQSWIKNILVLSREFIEIKPRIIKTFYRD